MYIAGNFDLEKSYVCCMACGHMLGPFQFGASSLAIKQLLRHLIEATIMTANYKGEEVFIPQIPILPSDLPFQFKRIQFPIRLSFAMTINKAQGQSLKIAGLNPAFHTANSTWDVSEWDHRATSSSTLPMERRKTLSTRRLYAHKL